MDSDNPDQPERNFGPGENPCDICGYTEFYWGNMYARKPQSDELKLRFRPSQFDPDDGDYFIEARLCKNCGNIKLFGVIP